MEEELRLCNNALKTLEHNEEKVLFDFVYNEKIVFFVVSTSMNML